MKAAGTHLIVVFVKCLPAFHDNSNNSLENYSFSFLFACVKVFLCWVANPMLEAVFESGFPIANDLDLALLYLVKLAYCGDGSSDAINPS